MTLATAARFEASERARVYPDLVRREKVDAEWAERDTRVWHAIADVLAGGRNPEALLWDQFDVTWADVRRTLDQAVASRAAACAKHPGDAALSARREAVHGILRIFGGTADHFTRPRAEALRKAA